MDDLRGRIDALDPPRRRLFVELLRARGGAVPADAPRGAERLVGFVVSDPGAVFDAQAIGAYLRARLPEPMVPSQLVALGALPRTPAGKLDRAALVREAPAPAAARAAAAGEEPTVTDRTTETLCRIWAEVLGLSEVGPHEDFFELGGDSLLSIRILARANQAGVQISPEQFFERPTVAQQAQVARSRTGTRGRSAAVTGPVPLLPIQHWFHECVHVDPQHWNQSMLFRLARAADLSALEAAVHALLHHHDGLRLQPGAPGGGEQRIVAPGPTVPVTRVVLDVDSVHDRMARMREHAAVHNASLDLAQAPLLRVVLFEDRSDGSQHLLIVAHHFLVDQVAWRVLLEDLEAALAAAEAGAPIRLPQKSSSIKAWSTRLVEYADSAAARAELGHWRRCAALPALLPDTSGDPAEVGSVGELRIHESTLDAGVTAALLRESPSRLRARTHEIVLYAFASALAAWCGSRELRFDLEGHGREPLFEDLDLSRTVGWLTCVYPVRLQLPPDDVPVEHALGAVREQLRAVPRGGIGYGVLRHLSSDEALRAELCAHPRSQVLFNYMGQTDERTPRGARLRPVAVDFGTPRSARAPRPYLLEVNAFVYDGELRVLWMHDARRHDAATIASLAAAFRAEIDRLLGSGGAVPASPSDFPMADLGQDDLDQLADVLKRIDDGR